MSKPTRNIEELRNLMLDTLDNLAAGKINKEEAATMGKIAEGIISGTTAQMFYAKMTNTQVHIPFFTEGSQSHRVIVMDEGIKKNNKRLENNVSHLDYDTGEIEE